MATPIHDLIASVERARASLVGAVAPLTDRQGAYKPSPDEWSIAEVLEHLYLAELGGITKIWAALNAVRSGERWTGPLPNRGMSIEDVIANTWKPQEAAPPVATPHLGGPLTAWISAHRSLQPVLRDLAMQLQGTDLEAIVFPHFLSGPLDARQRIEFIRYHIERHHQQVNRVRASAAFPDAS